MKYRIKKQSDGLALFFLWFLMPLFGNKPNQWYEIEQKSHFWCTWHVVPDTPTFCSFGKAKTYLEHTILDGMVYEKHTEWEVNYD